MYDASPFLALRFLFVPLHDRRYNADGVVCGDHDRQVYCVQFDGQKIVSGSGGMCVIAVF